ncbi:MAG: protein-L-isoaspartate(D-aspartate) O-methyltransferase [Pyrinomonadaceae bacterium]|nr:protein-L-isoaspartate(D-aspartate) O-methyltransferase [Pyrinomonadaceae bacterium]
MLEETSHPIFAEFRLPRQQMVERLEKQSGISDARVLSAMRFVPRHLFVPEALCGQAYNDNAVPIAAAQTISQPFIVAKMTELLETHENHKVLEIGAGSGYQSAILACLVEKVFAIERIAQLATEAEKRLRFLKIRNVNLRHADGTRGWEANAPFDSILIAAGSPTIPEPLLAQLKLGGKLVMPLGKTRESQTLVRVIHDDDGFRVEQHGSCSFVPLIGQHGWEN